MSEIAVYDDSAVNEWLAKHVNQNVHGYYMEILKLGMRTEITCQQTKDDAKLPSELYRALCRCPKYSRSFDKMRALSRFIYALRQLRKREKLSAFVSDDFLSQQGVMVPKFNLHEESSNFQFHQCLVEICVILDKRQRTDLLTYCTHICQVSSWNYKSIAPLMEMLLQTKINESDQYTLVEGLLYAQAKDCIHVIEQYRKANGLPEYDLDTIESQVESVSKEISPSESEGGFSDTRKKNQGPVSRMKSVLRPQRHRSRSKDHDDRINGDGSFNVSDELQSTSTSCSTPTHDFDATDSRAIESRDVQGSVYHNTGPVAAEQARVKKRRRKASILSFLSCCGLFAVLTATILVLVLLSVLQFNSKHTMHYQDTESVTPTTFRLATVNPFFTQKVNVLDNEEDTPQYQQHNVSLSVFESNCRDSVYEANPRIFKANSQSDSPNINHPTLPFDVIQNYYHSLLKRSGSELYPILLQSVDECKLPEPCEISIDSSMIGKRKCLQLNALIRPNPNNTVGYVNITVEFIPRLSAAVGFSVTGVLFALTCLCLVFACYCIIAY